MMSTGQVSEVEVILSTPGEEVDEHFGEYILGMMGDKSKPIWMSGVGITSTDF